MSAINVNSITGRTGSHGPVLTGVTTVSGDLNVNSSLSVDSGLSVTGVTTLSGDLIVGSGLSVTGISTFSNTVVGGATTELVVTGDARITGILTVGTSSLTLNGTDGTVTGINTINGLTYPSAGALSNRNLIINGAMTVAQRATSTSSITGTTEYRTLDRFKTELAAYSTVAGTVSQSTEAPTGFSKSIRFNVTTAETISASDLATIRYRVEAQDIQNLEYGTSNAKTTTLSFWVRSSITGTYGISLYQADAVRNLGLTYIVNTADTWEYKTLTIPGDTSGTINDDTGEGLQISWTLSAGSNFLGTTNTSWGAYSTNRWANGHAVDLMGATSNFYLTGVQLEVGERATPFEHRSYGDELARCQRYYEKSYPQGTAPGTNAGNFTGAYQSRDGTASTVVRYYPVGYKVTKRATPTVVVYNPQTGTSGQMRLDSNNESAAVSSQGDANMMVYSDDGSIPSHYGAFFHYTLNSEL